MPNVSDISFFYVGNCEPYFYIECRIAYWLWRSVPFILLAIGTVGNIINICVLSRQQLRQFSTGVYLLALAISDLACLWTSLLPDTIYCITGFRLMDTSEIFCRTRWWIAMTSAAFSVWVLVLLTLERTLLTKAPLFSKTRLTPRTAAISAAVALLVVLLINTHVIFGFSLNRSNTSKYDQMNETGNGLPCTFVTAEYGTFYRQTWSVIMFVLYTLLPGVIILTGNVNIALAILIRKKNMAKVAPANPVKLIAEERRKSSAKLLFLLSFIFMLTTMPYCIYFVVRGQIKEISERNVARWQLVTVLVNILGWCNFTFNFFLYFVNGTLFKQEWKKIVKKARENILKTDRSP